MSEEQDGGGFFLGFLVGLAVGAVASLLLAPASGEEMRRQLGDKSAELKGQAQRLAEDAKSQAQRLQDEARGQVEYVQEKGRIVLAENVRKVQGAVQDAQDKIAPENGTPA